MKIKKSSQVVVGLGVWLAGLAPLLAGEPAQQTANVSDLWGVAGEKWTPRSRLPDFSFAGCHAGEKPIPDVAVKASIKDFGAKGDGVTDDTAAFTRAIASVSSGAIAIPAGCYRITGALVIQKPGVVLRGAGEGKTTLYFEKSFEALLGVGKVPYWGGLLEVRGEQKGKKLTGVTAAARRGDTRLAVSSAAGISAGQWIRLRMRNPADNSLGSYLYADRSALNAERRRWYGGQIVDWVVPVAAAGGNTITLARPLRLDVRPQWQPEIWEHKPTVQEVGIENLTIEFPNAQYRGHWKEEGYYAFQLLGAYNCWVRRVTIIDSDIGVVIMAGGHNTVSGVTLKARWRAGGKTGETGHYGFGVSGHAQDNLVEDSTLLTTFVHNLSVNSFASGNVYSRITTRSARFDHHGGAPYENLFTQIVVTEQAHDLFMCGGNRADEANSGARSTLWNIRALKGRFPANRKPDKFPQGNVIGVDRWPTQKTDDDAWIEQWPGETTLPPNLYEAQKAHRLGKTATTTE